MPARALCQISFISIGGQIYVRLGRLEVGCEIEFACGVPGREDQSSQLFQAVLRVPSLQIFVITNPPTPETPMRVTKHAGVQPQDTQAYSTCFQASLTQTPQKKKHLSCALHSFTGVTLEELVQVFLTHHSKPQGMKGIELAWGTGSWRYTSPLRNLERSRVSILHSAAGLWLRRHAPSFSPSW